MSDNIAIIDNRKVTATFECVADMKACTTLTEGAVCRTLGYHKAEDGGGALYVIEKGIDEEDNEVVADDATVIETASTFKTKETGGEDQTGNDNETAPETENEGESETETEAETETETEAETPVPLVARFMNEGKPVNVLQFGAKNEFESLSNNILPNTRNDSVAIQKAIDYTDALLGRPTQEGGKKYDNNINTIVVPAGNYVIVDQIIMPPYMQMQLDGDVQFYSFVTAGDEQLYKHVNGIVPPEIDEEGYTVTSWSDQYCNYTNYCKTENDQTQITDITVTERKKDHAYIRLDTLVAVTEGNRTNETLEKRNGRMEQIDGSYDATFDAVCSEREVFAKSDIKILKNEVEMPLYADHAEGEYYVYKKGIIKICYRYDEKGNRKNPYNFDNGSRYVVSPRNYTEVFSGNGSLTILNKMKIVEKIATDVEKLTVPSYICGVEIGDYSEQARHDNKNSPVAGGDHYAKYEYLRFSNLKVAHCAVGILCRANNFYACTIKDSEFFLNKVGFQWGVYGETESTMDKYTWSYEGERPEEAKYKRIASEGILGEAELNSAELNHFRDCAFTGNDISVNIMLSAFNATFTSCHFDFDTCNFRAAYRTKLTIDKCHIEGTGKRLHKIYFEGAIPDTSLMGQFNNRAQVDPIYEFIGVVYAKPLVKFRESSMNNLDQVNQYSYVDISITNSRIIENPHIPWSMFSYYNKGEAEYSDGHHRSRLYLNNNTYAFDSSQPVSFLTTTDKGIVHSGFLLSEFPESELAEGEDGTEKDAVQNVPVISRDNSVWASFLNANKPRKNHRFLSNRTLENKYPYFQNVTVAPDGSLEGVDISVVGGATMENISFLRGGRPQSNVFRNYDDAAGGFDIRGTTILNSSMSNDFTMPKITIAFDGDIIKCEKNDELVAALVTDYLAYNVDHVENEVNPEKKLHTHTITFVELDDDGIVQGRYEYDVPYCMKYEDGEIVDSDNEDITKRTFNYSSVIYPSTSACKHRISNKNTTKVMMIANMCLPLDIVSEEGNVMRNYVLRALLVEKNK